MKKIIYSFILSITLFCCSGDEQVGGYPLAVMTLTVDGSFYEMTEFTGTYTTHEDGPYILHRLTFNGLIENVIIVNITINDWQLLDQNTGGIEAKEYSNIINAPPLIVEDCLVEGPASRCDGFALTYYSNIGSYVPKYSPDVKSRVTLSAFNVKNKTVSGTFDMMAGPLFFGVPVKGEFSKIPFK